MNNIRIVKFVTDLDMALGEKIGKLEPQKMFIALGLARITLFLVTSFLIACILNGFSLYDNVNTLELWLFASMALFIIITGAITIIAITYVCYMLLSIFISILGGALNDW
ncbi:hypothetical protein GKR75_07850 [Providencia sp. wls1919]|nr:hypothetical protein [Providencia sp. wls1919]